MNQLLVSFSQIIPVTKLVWFCSTDAISEVQTGQWQTRLPMVELAKHVEDGRGCSETRRRVRNRSEEELKKQGEIIKIKSENIKQAGVYKELPAKKVWAQTAVGLMWAHPPKGHQQTEQQHIH
jgi:hypothetical protein